MRKKDKNKLSENIGRKTVVLAIAAIFIASTFVPAIGSQVQSIVNNEYSEKSEEIEFRDLDHENNLDQPMSQPEGGSDPMPLGAGDPWWDYDWQYRKPINISHEKVDANLENFPVLISLDSDDNLSNSGQCQSNGDDIAFADKSGNKLNHEIEFFNSTSGKLIAWVNVTSLSSTVNTTLYMYYGNSGALNQQNPSDVWDNNYIMVQHLNETGSTVNDSTTYENNATSILTDYKSDCKINGGREYTNDDDYLLASDFTHSASTLTAEAWVYRDGTSFINIFNKGTLYNQCDWIFYLRTGSPGQTFDFSINNKASGCQLRAGTSPLGAWFYMAATYDSGTAIIYHNGTSSGSSSGFQTSINNNHANLALGNDDGGGQDWASGYLDEVRVSKTARGPDWIKTSYNTMSDPDSFFDIDPEEPVPPIPEEPVVSGPYPSDSATDVELNPTLSIDVEDKQGETVTVYFMSNASMSWSQIDTEQTGGNDTYTQTTTNMNSYGTKYWWSANVTDGTHWTNYTYSFTTLVKTTFNPCDEGWGYKRKITIDHDKVVNTLKNFTVLIKITDPILVGKTQSNGNDILFMDGDGDANKLKHEIELFNSTSGELIAWVKIPTLSSTANTTIYMYYDNSSATNQQNPNEAWDDNYVMVQHLNETGSTYYDSTNNGNNGTNTGTVFKEDCYIDGGRQYDDNDWITINNINHLPTALTAETWMYRDNTGFIYAFCKGTYSTTSDWVLYLRTASAGQGIRFIAGGGTYTIGDTPSGTWFHLTTTYNAGNVHIYVNGTEQGTGGTVGSTIGNSYPHLGIGNDYTGTNGASNPMTDVRFDEARISSVARNSSWIQTSFNSMSDPDSFFDIGSEEPCEIPEKPVVSHPSPADGATNVDKDLAQLSFDLTDHQNDSMDYWVETSPNIGSGNDAGVYNGTYSITVSGLGYLTTYTWFVNVTDPGGSGNWTNETYSFTTEPADVESPVITHNFAGNQGDSGGPHYLPGTATVAPDGYYTNDSHQQEDWIYINCTVTDNVAVNQVWLHWLNDTAWTNDTYQLTNAGGDYYEMNMSADIASGYDYSFDVFAVDPSENNATYQWLKAGADTTTVDDRRYVQLAGTPTDAGFTPYYHYHADYSYTMGYGSGHNQYNDDPLHHDQGPDGTLTNSGYLLAQLPTDTMETRYCGMYAVYWFDETVTAQSDTLDNVYQHVWWHTNDDNITLAYGKYDGGIFREDNWYQSYVTNAINAHSSVSYDGKEYYLESALTTITSPKSFTDNDIYEFFFVYYTPKEAPQTPWVISNRSVMSFVIFNVPDNTTLQGQDTDSDGLNDYEELYISYTNLFVSDTDNDGETDYFEHMNGGDPNDYTTQSPPQCPILSSESPLSSSTGQPLNATLQVTVNDYQNDTMNVTFRTNASGGTWADIGTNSSVHNGTYSQDTTNMDSYETTYFWSVNVTDGTCWTNATYHFTTAPFAPPEISILYPNFNTIRNSTKQVEDYVYTQIAVSEPINLAYVDIHQGDGNQTMSLSVGTTGSIDTWTGTPNDGTTASVNAGVRITPLVDGLKVKGIQHRLTSTQSFTVEIYDESCSCSIYSEAFSNIGDWDWTNFTGTIPELTVGTNYRLRRIESTNYHFRRNVFPREDLYIRVIQGVYGSSSNLNTQGVSNVSYEEPPTAELNLTNIDGVIPNITFYCKDLSGIWNSTTYERTFEVNCTPEDINYTQYYWWDWSYPSACSNSGPTYCCSPWWCMRHEQSVDATLTDTGIMNRSQPTPASGDNRRSCSSFTLHWFDESIALNPTVVDNVYYHLWWNSNSGAGVLDVDHVKAKNWHTTTGDAVAFNTATSNVNISHTARLHSQFYLNTGVMDVSDHLVDDNDIYNLAVSFLGDPDPNSPEVISMSNASSFIILNVPDNTTLQGMDSDSDGLNDYQELYVYFTDPFDEDTDDGGTNDYLEVQVGSNPLLTSDEATGPEVSDESPDDGSTTISTLNPPLSITVNHPTNQSMDVTFRTNASGSWADVGSNNSVQNGTYTQVPSNMNNYETTYYWSVNITDGFFWTNATYDFTTTSEPSDWWDNNWMYSKKIIINHNLVSANLNNFPVLIHNTSIDFVNHAHENGDDFVFVNEVNTTQYNHEIEYYDNISGELIVWVNIVEISSTEDTVLYLYYGYSGKSSQENIEDVWDSDYIMVQHLNDNGDQLNDSTSYNNNGTNSGTAFIGNCQVDGGRQYDNNDYITVNGFTHTPSALTAEAWVYRDDTSYINIFCDGTHFNTCDWILYLRSAYPGEGIDFGINNHGSFYRTGDTPLNTWFYLTVTYNAGSLNIYVNGTGVGSSTLASSINNNYADLGLGNDNDGGQPWADGKLDEIRISKIARSSDWIMTSYNTMSAPSTFFSMGTETQAGPEDTTPPEITNVDAQPDPQETGGFVNISCDVGDNVGVDEVWVNITYPDSGYHNESMLGGSYYYNTSYTMLGTYYYFIWANDTSDNSNMSSIYDFVIQDTMLPEITSVDAQPDPQETGGFVNISCDVGDNVGVDEVWVNITYPDSGYHNESMLGGSYYYNTSYTMLGTYYYFIWANDTSDNSNMSSIYDFVIQDTMLPEITSVDAQPDPQETGGFVNISCDVGDNVGVDEVWVNITYPDSGYHNESMLGGSYYYNTSYTMLGTYYYFIWANDTSDNSNMSSIYDFVIQDTMLPEITSVDAQPDPQETGGFVNISCDVGDNVGVDEVWVNITYPDSGYHNESMLGGSYYYNTSYTMLGTYYYFIWANDTSDNSNTSATHSFNITGVPDTESPEILIVLDSPDPQESGKNVNITAVVTDNVGVSQVYLNITHPDNSVENISITSNKTGNTYYCDRSYTTTGVYNYTIWASDASGNTDISPVCRFSIVRWNVVLNISSSGSLSDTAVFGEVDDASDSQDSYDMPKSPAPGEPYVYAWFDAGLSEPYDKLWEDYRQYPGSNKVWDLYIRCNTSGPAFGFTDITVSWDSDEVNDSEYVNGSVVLHYCGNGSVVADMMTDGSYTFKASFDLVYHFQIQCAMIQPELSYISLHTNWNMISLPFNESINKTDIVVSYAGSNYSWDDAVSSNIILGYLYNWDRTSQGYETKDTLEPGYGYWMWAYHDCTLKLSNQSPPIDDNYITALKQEWNMMGLPYNTSLVKEDLIIHYNVTDYSWYEAISGNNEEGEPLILGFIYGWNRSAQMYELSDEFDPGYGYWMYAYYNCTLKKEGN